MILAPTDLFSNVVVFEPTSDSKACKFLDVHPLYQAGPVLAHFAPNLQELAVFAEAACKAYPELQNDSAAHYTSLKDTPLELAQDPDFVYNASCVEAPAWFHDRHLWANAMVALSFTKYLWVKAGAEGVCLFTRTQSLAAGNVAWPVGKLYDQWSDQPNDVIGMWFRPLEIDQIRNSIGAGDSMLGSVLAGLSRGLDPENAAQLNKLVELGQR